MVFDIIAHSALGVKKPSEVLFYLGRFFLKKVIYIPQQIANYFFGLFDFAILRCDPLI
jgi:hypothetical protein